jgi:hypothetical protein|tara:strand:- start:93 stop:221 length:129 start_codon:yes stop_codon:yes gene_type:complete
MSQSIKNQALIFIPEIDQLKLLAVRAALTVQESAECPSAALD